MNFRFTEEEEAFRKEVQDYFKEILPADWMGADPDMYEEDGIEEFFKVGVEVQRKMGAKGWLGMTWPKKYGGQEAPVMKEVILEEEINYRGVPGYDAAAFAQAGLILLFGTEEQKMKYIPPVARGEVRWGLGMSEPNAGSDLFALKTRAIEEGDYFIINGQKTWQSAAHHADYCILYTLTDLDAPKGLGVSGIIVDLHSPGIEMRRLQLPTGMWAFNEVFYDNVKVPKENLLGKLNEGRKLVMAALGAERGYGIALLNNSRRYLDMLVDYCKETGAGKDPLIRNKLAQIAVEIEVGRAMCYRLIWAVTAGLPTIVESSQVKIYGATASQRLATLGMEILGLYGQLDEKSKWAKLRGRMKYMYIDTLAMSIAGGTNEVSKNAMAGRGGLELPRG
ncbi:acyl-CoA dehydrogenase family protein [Chloroflexota bacterium]